MNSKVRVIAIAAACLAIGSARGADQQPATPKEKVSLVKVSEFDKTASYQIMTPEELKTLDDDIRLEGRLFGKALTAADKDWRKSETNKGKMYPAGKISQRRLAVVSEFSDRQQAENRKTAIEEQEAEREERDRDREAERERVRREASGTTRHTAAKPKGKAPEKDFMFDEALQLFKSKMEELKTLEKQKQQKPAADGAAK
jgi:hypothetical protein